MSFSMIMWIQNMEKKQKLCYMNTDSFIVYKKTEDISINIAKDVETRLDTSNYELERPLPRGKNKKGINERWIRWNINEFAALRA